jgi:hypothetical protein
MRTISNPDQALLGNQAETDNNLGAECKQGMDAVNSFVRFAGGINDIIGTVVKPEGYGLGPGWGCGPNDDGG